MSGAFSDMGASPKSSFNPERLGKLFGFIPAWRLDQK
jgi:hypothetical protein